MKSRALLGTLFVACLTGCSPPPPKSPVEDPGLPEPEAVEPEAAEPEASAPESEEPPAAAADPGGAEKAPGPSEEPVEEKSCAKLKKATCKVTQGCAWQDGPPKGQCIERGEEF